MRKFKELEKKYKLKIMARSVHGWLYLIILDEKECLVRLFNGDIPAKYIRAYSDIVSEIFEWINSRPDINKYVEAERIIEIGEDYIIRPFIPHNISLSAFDGSEDYPELPEELALTQEAVRNKIGKAYDRKNRVIDDILTGSLLRPSGKTFFDEHKNKFIIAEPKISLKHLDEWALHGL